jgi:hypothetical protein
MNVDRLVEREPFIEVLGESQCMAFRVGLREFAIGVAGAGNQAVSNV